MRLTFNDDLRESVLKLADGNPGAATAIMETYKELGAAAASLLCAYLDQHEIYGSDIWLLYKDHCNFDTTCFCNTVDKRILEGASFMEGLGMTKANKETTTLGISRANKETTKD